MIRAIIVDDEFSAIKSLKWEIEKFCKGIEVSNYYTNPVDAIEGIEPSKARLCFSRHRNARDGWFPTTPTFEIPRF